MLQNIKKRTNSDNKGFTIIEVLIVLAIAGLILLIVFLAVPALQRNSRNTQRKNQVSGILGALQEVANNNGGTLNSTAAPISLPHPTQLDAVTGPYTAAQINYTAINSGGVPTVVAAQSVLDVVVRSGLKCNNAYTAPITTVGGAGNFVGVSIGNAANQPATTTQATFRNIVVLYGVETNNNTYQLLCQES